MTAASSSLPDRVPGTAPLVGKAWSLFVALAFLMVGNGLLGSLLGVRAELEGFGTATTGVVMAAYYVGFLAGSQITPITVTRVGHVRVFAGLASLTSATALVYSLAVNPIAWGLVRLVTGACMAGLYVVAESWLNADTPNAARGRLLSVYVVVVMGGIGIGQLLLGWADPANFTLFVVASLLISLAVVPIVFSVAPAPVFEVPPRMKIGEMWRASPIGIIGGLGTGMANGALFALAPVFGIMVGMSVGRISMFMGVGLLGAVLLQWPIGAWSDRVPRRRSIVVVNLVAATSALALTLTHPNGPGVLVAMFFLGGSTFPLYSLNVSHVNDVLDPDQTVAASSMFVFVTGVGSVLGPITAAVLMARTDPNALFWVVAGVHLTVAVYTMYRIIVHEGPTISEQDRYLPIPARASAIVGILARNRGGNRRKAR